MLQIGGIFPVKIIRNSTLIWGEIKKGLDCKGNRRDSTKTAQLAVEEF